MKQKAEKIKHLIIILGAITIFLMVAGNSAIANAAGRYGILGQTAPELNLNTWIDGNGNTSSSLKLGDYQGKVIYMYFFQAWCPGCHAHGFPTLKALTKEFEANPDVVFLAVQTTFEGFSINTEDKLKENQDKYDLRIPMAHDQGNTNSRRLPKTMSNYRSGGTPWTVIIDPDGTIAYNEFHIQKQHASDLILELLEKRG